MTRRNPSGVEAERLQLAAVEVLRDLVLESYGRIAPDAAKALRDMKIVPRWDLPFRNRMTRGSCAEIYFHSGAFRVQFGADILADTTLAKKASDIRPVFPNIYNPPPGSSRRDSFIAAALDMRKDVDRFLRLNGFHLVGDSTFDPDVLPRFIKMVDTVVGADDMDGTTVNQDLQDNPAISIPRIVLPSQRDVKNIEESFRQFGTQDPTAPAQNEIPEGPAHTMPPICPPIDEDQPRIL